MICLNVQRIIEFRFIGNYQILFSNDFTKVECHDVCCGLIKLFANNDELNLLYIIILKSLL